MAGGSVSCGQRLIQKAWGSRNAGAWGTSKIGGRHPVPTTCWPDLSKGVSGTEDWERTRGCQTVFGTSRPVGVAYSGAGGDALK